MVVWVFWGHGKGEGCRTLSSSCPCWGADHLWAIVAPGMGDIGDGGAVLVDVVARSDWRWGISCLLHFDRLYSFGTTLLEDAIPCI